MIRAATSRDTQAIADIWNPIIRNTTITFTPDEKSLKQVGEYLSNCLVCEVNGVLKGFACYGAFRGGAGYRYSAEHTIYLAADACGQGLGGPLLAALCNHAKDAGIHMMHAGISGENPRAVDFHAAHGFTTLAVLPEVGFKVGRWIDLVLMQKRL